ncbi:hypothetical protein [Halovivax sp.]|uniref:DUF7533 family protein n=1 Tax=Halovivax sp. TaxID=1935978 RepID=UPI0025BE9276|nr:hypothetical protein [Halovivax sp.]
MGGIVDTIKLAGVLVFAIPAAMAGMAFLSEGNVALGGGLLGLAVGLVALKRVLTLPTDVPALLAKRVGAAVATDPEDGDE